jgi:hypothetical protein
VTGGSQSTNSSGLATVGSWTLGNSGSMTTSGTYTNGLNATASVGTASFTAAGRYSFASQIQPFFSAHCAGCHTGGGTFGGLALDPGAAYGDAVGVASTCNGSFDRVATGGGTTAEANSVMMMKLDNLSTISGCSGVMPTTGELTLAQRDTIRAWIRNSAPNN